MKSLLVSSIIVATISCAQPDPDSGSSIDPPFMGQRTTCDQCTIYNYNFWCPVDYSCYTPEPIDVKYATKSTQQVIRGQCNRYCAAVYKEENPDASDEVAAQNGQCSDMQQCFFSADQCSDCTLSSGYWCTANRKCYAFQSKFDLPLEVNESQAPNEYICLEDCPDKSCIQKEPQCPSCEQLRPPLTCGALLPAFVVASSGAGFFVTLIAWFVWSYIQQRRKAQRAQQLLEQKREQRLAAKRAGRAAARAPAGNSKVYEDYEEEYGDGGNSLRFEPTQVSYD